MNYETVLGICQLVALVIFSSVMTGILVHVFRPKNRQRFEAAARIALRCDDETGTPHGH